MSFPSYSPIGYGETTSLGLPTQAQRDPVSHVDVVAPNGATYIPGNLWINMLTQTVFFYSGSGNWVLQSNTTGDLLTLSDTAGTLVIPTGAGNIRLAGTANQIAITAGSSVLTFTIPAAFTAPGSITATTTVTAGTGITSTTGNIVATAGAVNAGTTMTAGTGVTATTGNIVATAGAVNAGTTMTAGTGITATTGNIVATAGAVNAGTTMTAGTGITATTGNIVATAGAVNAGTTMTAGTGITSTTGNIVATAGAVNAGTTMTATAGDITATNGNFVSSAAGKGLQFNANTATGAAPGPVVLNSRAGQVIFTGVSIAAAADLTLTITNSAITGATTQVIYSMSGSTTGSAPSIKSVTNSAGSSAIVVTNGTGATTTTEDITLNFIVVN